MHQFWDKEDRGKVQKVKEDRNEWVGIGIGVGVRVGRKDGVRWEIGKWL